MGPTVFSGNRNKIQGSNKLIGVDRGKSHYNQFKLENPPDTTSTGMEAECQHQPSD